MNIKEAVEKRFLVKEKLEKDLIDKEIKESAYDSQRAQKAFEEKDYKWAIIQCYYSMFHAAKAVCFTLGYREKKHFALVIILEELSNVGKLEQEYVNYFKAAIDSREEADYHYNYSQDIAEHSLKMAFSFNERMKELIKEM